MSATINLNEPPQPPAPPPPTPRPTPRPGPLERIRWALDDWYQHVRWQIEDAPITAAVAVLLVLIGVWGLMPDMAAQPAVQVPTPRIEVPTPRIEVPTPTPAGLKLPAATVAYASPDGAVLGALDAGRSYRPLARYGAAWLFADVEGSGAVWLPVEAVGLPAGQLADIAPTPAPVVVVIERSAPPPAVAHIIQSVPAPLAPPAPESTECPSWSPPMAPGYCPPTAPAEGWAGVPYVLPEEGR